jgi:hypothetical protein
LIVVFSDNGNAGASIWVVNRALCGSVHDVSWRRTEFQLLSLDEIVKLQCHSITKPLLPLCSKCVIQAMDTAVEKEEPIAEQQQQQQRDNNNKKDIMSDGFWTGDGDDPEEDLLLLLRLWRWR